MRLRAGTLALLAAVAVAPAAGAATLEQVGTFASPTYVTGPPGDPSRLFVVERPGTVRVLRDGAALERPFLDVSGRIVAGGEEGLLSLAFAPDYASSGLFYVYFTDRAGDLVVEEGRRSAADPDVADASYRREVIRVGHPGQGNHNGGQLQFGPDGLLYAGTGDGGGGGDPNGNAQNDDSRLGKLLRIDPRVPGAAPENFAKGLRNPWRFSFDRSTGDLAIGDVGQNAVEEIAFAAASGRG
jgi:glucose/arabinose dehydrogenase